LYSCYSTGKKGFHLFVYEIIILVSHQCRQFIIGKVIKYTPPDEYNNSLSMESRPVNQIFSFFPARQTVCGLTFFSRNKPPYCTLVDLEQLSLLLEQPGNDLPAALLSKEEQCFFSRFSYPKRRREWFGGRIAAKGAILACSDSTQSPGPPMHKMTILPDDHGRPVTRHGTKLMVSISHSHRFAVACATDQSICGIDLQKTSSRLAALTSRFTCRDEQHLLTSQYPGLPEESRLTMIWTTKEAVKKSLLHDQPSVFSGINIEQVQTAEENEHHFLCRVTGYAHLQKVAVYIFLPYILALTGGADA
jgi:phosphopantetheinyl transferase